LHLETPIYRKENPHRMQFQNFYLPFGGELSGENRWVILPEQSIGWEPDMNDGIRLNVRPFMASDIPGGKKGAGILLAKPNIKCSKDRGKEPQRPKEEYPLVVGLG